MKLLIVTPAAVVVDAEDVAYVRAEDETGSFGILRGHADFITALVPSVVTWRDGAGHEHHAAVRGGALSVSGGKLVEIATREAVGEDTLEKLGESVLERFRNEADAEDRARVSAAQLQAATIRQLQRYLDAARGPIAAGAPTAPFARPEPGSGGDA
ncbi:MAG: F0F1 ATP synthase subunit epsilon [Rhodospirillaceae bacterium]|nr:F0F1 ATP synthase subunit epsilon [Rhodospirillaceae bacterium]